MRSALIVSVGTGTRPDSSITRPIVRTIRDSNPSFVCFIASEESLRFAEAAASELQLEPNSYRIEVLKEVDLLDRVYSRIRSVIRELLESGYLPDDISVDFTSGTKVMSTALVLAAADLGCSRFRYVSGERAHGVVIDNTERTIAFSREFRVMVERIDLARELIRRLHFESAIRVTDSINRSLLDESSKAVLEELHAIASAYDSWQKFEYFRASSWLEKASFSHLESRDFAVSRGALRRRLIAIGEGIRKGMYTPDLLADLFNNAWRCWFLGRYDDALARLYRLAEMLAQYELQTSYSLDTSDFDCSKVPESFSRKLIPDERDGRVKLALERAYEALNVLGSPLGSAFFSNEKLRHLLFERNATFLAHGTSPAKEESCKRLMREILPLATAVIGHFSGICDTLQFPWVKSETSWRELVGN